MLEHGIVTIQKLAEKAGVSRGTVDRVLNNRPGVDPAVRDRVLTLVRELGYRPNQAAKALGFNKNPFSLGVLLPPRDILFFEGVRAGIRAAQTEFQDFGLKIEERFVSNRDPLEAVRAIEELVDLGVRGLMVTAMDHPLVRLAIDAAVDRGIPVVTFNSDIESYRRSCFVGQDLRSSGRIAAGLMAKMLPPEAKILAVTGSLQFQAQRSRLEGFWEGWDRDRVVAVEGFDLADVTGREVASALALHPDVAGLYQSAGSVEASLGALAHHRGPRVRVVCNDLLDDVRQGLEAGLVDFTILQDEFAQGYRPVRLLFEHLTENRSLPLGSVFVSSTIMIRETLRSKE